MSKTEALQVIRKKQLGYRGLRRPLGPLLGGKACHLRCRSISLESVLSGLVTGRNAVSTRKRSEQARYKEGGAAKKDCSEQELTLSATISRPTSFDFPDISLASCGAGLWLFI